MRFAIAMKTLIVSIVFLSFVGWANQAHAQIGVGTWVRTDAQGKGITMTVEVCCGGGRRLIAEAPALVGGKPSGETMAIKRVDDRHYTGVVKMGGKPFGTSSATISPDGKTITVESVTEGAGKIIETWVLK